jgi:hypothetical protein
VISDLISPNRLIGLWLEGGIEEGNEKREKRMELPSQRPVKTALAFALARTDKAIPQDVRRNLDLVVCCEGLDREIPAVPVVSNLLRSTVSYDKPTRPAEPSGLQGVASIWTPHFLWRSRDFWRMRTSQGLNVSCTAESNCI